MLSEKECLEAYEKLKYDHYLITEDDDGNLIHINNLYKNELNLFKNLINEHFENSQIEWLRNCIGNETFNLIFSSQEEVKRWFDRIRWHVKECDKLGRKLQEIESNPPLKFEELKVGMWAWDNKYKVYNCISRIYENLYPNVNAIQFKYLNETTQWGYIIEFEENRFYRKLVMKE